MRKCFFIHEKEASSILTKSGLKHLVAVTPSIGANAQSNQASVLQNLSSFSDSK